MITAQCDSIMVTQFLRPMTLDLIPQFETFYRTGNPINWFTLYICTFILLEEVSFSCQDRRRHATENWVTDVCFPSPLAFLATTAQFIIVLTSAYFPLQARYTVSNFVRELQFSANIVLCHWHYFRTMDPMDDGWEVFCQIIIPRPQPQKKIESAKGKGKKKVLITQEQCNLITRHWRKMTEICESTCDCCHSTPSCHTFDSD